MIRKKPIHLAKCLKRSFNLKVEGKGACKSGCWNSIKRKIKRKFPSTSLQCKPLNNKINIIITTNLLQ